MGGYVMLGKAHNPFLSTITFPSALSSNKVSVNLDWENRAYVIKTGSLQS